MNYQELLDAARAYADRNDVEVDANVDIFIIMAEARINRALKVAQQTHRVYTQSIDTREFYTLPDEYNGMRVIHFNTGEVDVIGSDVIHLNYTSPEHLGEIQASGETHGKYYYTVVNRQIQVHPTLPGGGTIEMVFYRKVPALTSIKNTNWLSEDSPDIYLSGICAEIELFVKNYDAANLWDDRMTRAITEIQDNNVQNRWNGNSLVTRAE